MNNIEPHGIIVFKPETYEWTSIGTGWYIKQITKNAAKIIFEEPMVLEKETDLICTDYLISINNINNNGKIEIYDINEKGFCLRWEGFSKEVCKALFSVSQKKANGLNDDRELINKQSIEDIYASSLLFDYQAKYGVVAVMGASSIESKETVEAAIDKWNEFIKNTQYDIANENDSLKREKLQYKIEQANRKIKHQEIIKDKCIDYWHSAKKFGELWGKYAANDQKQELGGCYIPICTGGGAGIMSAVAKGARNENAHVLGIDCQLGKENSLNLENITHPFSNITLRLNNMSIRESVLINYSHVILFWPGGFGTVWEVFETLSKLQTSHLKRHRIKAIFVHKDYWEPLFKLINHMRDFGTINDTDRIKIPGMDDLMDDEFYIGEVVDTAEEAFKKTRHFILELYKKNQLTIK